jgi:hypothetical protein
MPPPAPGAQQSNQPASIKPPEGLTLKNMMDMTPQGYQLAGSEEGGYTWEKQRPVEPIPGGRAAGKGESQEAVNQIEQNRMAYEAYWNRPDVQQGFQAQAEMGREKPDFRRQWGGEAVLPMEDKLPAAPLPEAPVMPVQQVEAPEVPKEVDERTRTQKIADALGYKALFGRKKPGEEHEEPSEAGAEVVKHIPPELVGIGGRMSPFVAIAQELINPSAAAAAPLEPEQQVELFERAGKTGDPEYQKVKERVTRESSPEYQKTMEQIRQKLPARRAELGRQEEKENWTWPWFGAAGGGGRQTPVPNAALDAVQAMQGGASAAQALQPQSYQPPKPQGGGGWLRTETGNILFSRGDGGGSGGVPGGGPDGAGIAAAIKEAISSVMDRYWAG